MEALLSVQEELFDNLIKAERNFKKTSKDKIKRQYIETRLELLEQLYKDFKDGHGPNDPLPLTPGHFLIGEPLLNLADENYSLCKIPCHERWRLTQKIVNDFWNRWSKEYLVSLNQRYKWNTKKSEPEIGDIVILKEDNIPPSKWVLGKIIHKNVGPDNITRVVSIKCKNGIFKRPLNKICMLLKQNNND